MSLVADRFENEAVMRGCIRAGVNVVSRNRKLESAGCRKRAFEKVRCDPPRLRLLASRYAPYGDFLCGPFLCAGLYGIWALAVSASAKPAIPIKTLRFITLSVVDFVNQTPATDTSCTPTKLRLRVTDLNDRTRSLTASFEFIALVYVAAAILILILTIRDPLQALKES